MDTNVALYIIEKVWNSFSNSTAGHWIGDALLILFAYSFVMAIIEDIAKRIRGIKGE